MGSHNSHENDEMVSPIDGYEILIGILPFKKCFFELEDSYRIYIKSFKNDIIKTSLYIKDEKINVCLKIKLNFAQEIKKKINNLDMIFLLTLNYKIMVSYKDTQYFTFNTRDEEKFESLKKGKIILKTTTKNTYRTSTDYPSSLQNKIDRERHINLGNYVIFNDSAFYITFNARTLSGSNMSSPIQKGKMIYFDYSTVIFIENDTSLGIFETKTLKHIQTMHDEDDILLNTTKENINVEFTDCKKTFTKEFIQRFHSSFLFDQIENEEDGKIYLPISSKNFSPDNIQTMEYLGSAKLISCMIRHFKKLPFSEYIK